MHVRIDKYSAEDSVLYISLEFSRFIIFSFPVLFPANYSCSQLWTMIFSFKLRSLLGFTKLPLPWASPRDPCFLLPDSWKLLFCMFKLFGFLVISGRKVNIIPITLFWQKSWLLFFQLFLLIYLLISLYLEWFSHRQYPVTQSLHYNWYV